MPSPDSAPGAAFFAADYKSLIFSYKMERALNPFFPSVKIYLETTGSDRS